MYLMSAAWGSLALILAALGAAYGWWVWRREGVRGLVLGAGLVGLPIGLWLTGTLRLVGFLVDWFAGWATGLVFSPSVIVGTALVVVAVLLLGAGSRMAGRSPRPAAVTRARAAEGAAAGRRTAADDDLADIEALLRRRGLD